LDVSGKKNQTGKRIPLTRENIQHYDVGYTSHQGLTKDINEDNYCAEVLKLSEGASMGTLAVADGFGGFSLGEIASKITINQVEKFYKLGEFRQMFEEAEFLEPERVIQQLYTRINHVVRTLIEKENQNIGCSLVSGFFFKDQAYVASIGNCRAFLIRNGAIKRITENPSGGGSDSGSDYFKSGDDLTTSGSKLKILQNSLGSGIGLKADVVNTNMQNGDIYLFCSDGVYSQVREDELLMLAREYPVMQGLCNAIIEKANLNGGKDNSTVVALRFTSSKPNLKTIIEGWKKSGFLTPKSLVIGMLVLSVFMILIGVLAKKVFDKQSLTKSNTNTSINSPPGHTNVYNSLTLNSEVPLEGVIINGEKKQVLDNTDVFVFERISNEIKIMPDFKKMGSSLYTITISGYARGLMIEQAATNRVVMDPGIVKVHLTSGSKIYYKTAKSGANDVFYIKIDHLGSPFAVVMETQENTLVNIEFEDKKGGVLQKSNPGSSSSGKSSQSAKPDSDSGLIEYSRPGANKREKLDYELQ
jgi:PPM family protein phosphatase